MVPAYIFVEQGNPGRLGSAELPAPASKVWEGVARLLAQGLHALPKGALAAIVVAAVLGVVLTLLEEFAPKKWKPWIPSTSGLGIAGVIQAFNSIAMFVGALIAWLVSRASPKVGGTFTVPVPSGLIAGESLMGVATILTLEILKATALWAG